MKVREKMFYTLDQLKGKKIESLRAIEGVLYFEDIRRDQIVFSLPFAYATPY
jgi:regulatory protein YycI of two-component signal transduction system YycFG